MALAGRSRSLVAHTSKSGHGISWTTMVGLAFCPSTQWREISKGEKLHLLIHLTPMWEGPTPVALFAPAIIGFIGFLNIFQGITDSAMAPLPYKNWLQGVSLRCCPLFFVMVTYLTLECYVHTSGRISFSVNRSKHSLTLQPITHNLMLMGSQHN